MKNSKWVVALAAVALLVLALPVHGQTGAQGAKYQTATGMRLIGVLSDSTQKLLTTDASGNLYIREAAPGYTYTTSPRTLIGPVATLGPGNTATSTAAVSLGEYSSLLVMVSWNTVAAADSDSVAFGATFIGKISTDTNDGYDYLVGAVGDTAARFARIDTASVYGTSQWKSPTVFVISATKPRVVTAGQVAYSLKPTSVTGPKAYYVNTSRTVFSDGRNGVCFVLRDPSGATLKFSHLMVAVTNLAGTVTYNNVKVDVWPKVN